MSVDTPALIELLGKRAQDYLALAEEHGDVHSKIVALVLFEITAALIELEELEEAA